jgi:hypothetical protein
MPMAVLPCHHIDAAPMARPLRQATRRIFAGTR